jgi:hypothetical protein
MTDPTNLLPIDPEWVRKVDALNEAAVKELGCMVLTIAVQENGKLGISIGGVPKTGELAELAEDVPRLLLSMAGACALQDAILKKAAH